MIEYLKKLIASFDNDNAGFSARKLSAFAAVATAIYITVKEIPKEFLIEALYAWLGFALLCLGIITLEQIIKFKNPQNDPTTN